MTLAAASQRAAAAILAKPKGTRWFIACDTDADGLCAAAVMASALTRAGHRFIVRASRDKTAAAYQELASAECDGYILVDKGTSHLPVLGDVARATKRPVVVIDHHNLQADDPDVVHVNPRAAGLDGGRDASASTTAAAVAMALTGDKALASGPAALAGAIGDWQHMGGWRGWNLELLERTRAAGHLKTVVYPRLIGLDLAEALARHKPELPGLSGDPGACRAWLDRLGITVDADVEDLDVESRTKLVSAMALAHRAAGHKQDALKSLTMETDCSVKLGTSLRRVFRVVDACGREGDPSTGVAYLLGDPVAARDAIAHFDRYRMALREGLEAIAGRIEPKAAVQVAWTSNPDYTGMVAGLAVTHLLKDRKRPLAVLAHRKDGLVQVSTRGTNEQVLVGLDLGRAVKVAAEAVACEGGGHPVAAGSVIAPDHVKPFLDVLDKALMGQRFLERQP